MRYVLSKNAILFLLIGMLLPVLLAFQGSGGNTNDFLSLIKPGQRVRINAIASGWELYLSDGGSYTTSHIGTNYLELSIDSENDKTKKSHVVIPASAVVRIEWSK